jgi:hypothetical protein
MSQNNLDEQRKSELVQKFKQGTITRREAIELKTSLEQEKEQASLQGNPALVLGIAILLGFVIKYLAEHKIIDLDAIKKFFSGK